MVYMTSSKQEPGIITYDSAGKIEVPNFPVIPFILGDGIGVDVTPAMQRVVDAAVERCYGGQRAIIWKEIFAGERAVAVKGDALPQETLEAIKHYKVAIKGPLTTPVGEGFRSLNVALRQELDLYICLRPVRYYPGTPSVLKNPELVDMVIFRENSEDIYVGIEWEEGSVESNKVIKFLQEEMNVDSIRFTPCGIGIKPVSRQGTERIAREAFKYALTHKLRAMTIVHKGNIMKYTEGAFQRTAYEVARKEFGATTCEKTGQLVMTCPQTGHVCVINDVIADAFLQQILLRPAEYHGVLTLNLNGDYISDALAAQVGGIGIAPGANIGEQCALFEATHGTAPRYAGLDKVNPGSIILSAKMMLDHMGWVEAGAAIDEGVARAIKDGQVTYDFHRSMEGATLCSTSQFAQAVIDRLP